MSEPDDLVRAEEKKWAYQIRTRMREESDVIEDSIIDHGKEQHRSMVIWHWVRGVVGAAFFIWLVSFVWWILEGGLKK
jgi:hypothetical protein